MIHIYMPSLMMICMTKTKVYSILITAIPTISLIRVVMHTVISNPTTIDTTMMPLGVIFLQIETVVREIMTEIVTDLNPLIEVL